jgi:hypothetical protein
MGLQRIVHRTGFIGGALAVGTTVLPVDQGFLDIIAATMDFVGGDYFYMTIEEDELVEEVKVTNATDTYLVIQRGRGPTTAKEFSLAAVYNTDMTAAEINERAAGLAPVAPLTLVGTGGIVAEETNPGEWTLNMPIPVIGGQNGIEVATVWPNYTIGIDMSTGCCADGEGTGSDIPYVFVGGGITTVSVEGTEVAINTPSPNFTGDGVEITGAWPNLNFAIEAAAGGTVTSVTAGTGLGQTGNPNVNPTLFISNTGVVAGDYGGIVVNSRGQITAMPEGFNPVSGIAVGDDGLQVDRTGGVVTITALDATESVKGIVQFADSEAALDPDDVTTAVTPKLLASVLSDIDSVTENGGETYNGEPDGDYATTAATAALPITLLTGQKALVFIETTAKDAADTDPVEYGISAWRATAGTRIFANRKLKQSIQTMMFGIDGPFSDAILVKHTALTGTETLVSHSVRAIIF